MLVMDVCDLAVYIPDRALHQEIRVYYMDIHVVTSSDVTHS